MKIAILGATSQIAKDLIVSFSVEESVHLHLFARRPDEVRRWLKSIGLSERYPVDDFSIFTTKEFDAVINFVGVGNPAQAAVMGNAIFDITLRFDDMVMDYLKAYPTCRYLFLSSGAAYGSSFNEPATSETKAVIPINHLEPHEWYGVAKLYAECRHRSHPDLNIVDIRVFNYFSHTQDIEARFLITDIVRAIRDKAVLKTTADYIVRDFLHPSDFYQMVGLLLSSPPANLAIDCYSLAPIDKPNLLAFMHENFGLSYAMAESDVDVNATGNKPYYYSMNRVAEVFGYVPSFTSLEGIVQESSIILKQNNITGY